MGNSEGDGANIEWSGWGYLDEERTRWIEFLLGDLMSTSMESMAILTVLAELLY